MEPEEFRCPLSAQRGNTSPRAGACNRWWTTWTVS